MTVPRVSSRRKLTLLSLFLAACTFIVRVESQEPPKTLKVTVYYETLCPDSVRFFRSQFQPSMTDMGRYNYTEIEFVPYGKVMVYTPRGSSQSVLYCQHGRKECDLNAKHACIIENNNKNETYNMITGLMSGFNSNLDMFASEYGVDLAEAKSCRESRSVREILQPYGTKTDSLNPSFIPTITIDEEQRDEKGPPKKLKVSIYYESLCPHSSRFFRTQFRPSMRDHGRYNHSDIQFIPYGRVEKHRSEGTSEIVLRCQHGKKECDLNAKHACIIENTNKKDTFEMITDLMAGLQTNLDPIASKYGVNLDKAKECAQSRSVVDILEKYGNYTDALDKDPKFIPIVVLDEKFDWDEQTEILHNFDKVFCRKYEEKFDIKLEGC